MPNNDIAQLADYLAQSQQKITQQFKQNVAITELLCERSNLVDQILRKLWYKFLVDAPNIALIASGGYGRRELHPFSDIDILILLRNESAQNINSAAIAEFISGAWDLGLKIGASVHHFKSAVKAAKNDLVFITSIMESRFLIGYESLYTNFLDKCASHKMWSGKNFFLAKRREYKKRHKKYGNTEYNLEPNLKESPGALRDIQTIFWVLKRFNNVQNILQEKEQEDLLTAQQFLWRVRFALHLVASAPEERLLFDLQLETAQMLGIKGQNPTQIIENFMQQYHLNASKVSIIGELVLLRLAEQFFKRSRKNSITPINDGLQINGDYLEFSNQDCIKQNPSLLLQIFVILAQEEQVKGLSSNAIAQIRQNLNLIDADFRQNPTNCVLFMRIFKAKRCIHRNLRFMLRYGVLAQYLPEIGKIMGQIQHDLFHIYTVDAHTLNLIKNIRKFLWHELQQKYSLASELMLELPKPNLLYLAGLLHDIGKGSGFDHSIEGAKIAANFCARHNLKEQDTKLIVWLVRNHLLMSQTAQKQDISDAGVITNFAQEVKTLQRLNYLYLLTVADINATNPKLWNSWRASLLRQLYVNTKQALLQQNLALNLDAAQIKNQALSLLEQNLQQDAINLWQTLDDNYIKALNAQELAWQTSVVLTNNQNEVKIDVRQASAYNNEGSTQIFIHMPNKMGIFATTSATLSLLNLQIFEARITTSSIDQAWDMYLVLDEFGELIPKSEYHKISQTLAQNLQTPSLPPAVNLRRLSRQMQYFAAKPLVRLSNDIVSKISIIEVITADRLSVVAIIGQIFMRFGLQIAHAKITTLGVKVIDTFFVLDENGKPLSDAKMCQELKWQISINLSL